MHVLHDILADHCPDDQTYNDGQTSFLDDWSECYQNQSDIPALGDGFLHGGGSQPWKHQGESDT